MLAQNFKTAIDLGISEAQADALRKTLVLLETGKLQYFDVSNLYNSQRFCGHPREFSGHFNMETFGTRHECGTAACIAGTAELISGIKFVGMDRPDALENLFYGDDASGNQLSLSEITPSQAATALRSYLTTGDARWDLAVA